MSLNSLVYVTCDVCGNPCGGVENMRDNAESARSLAKIVGLEAPTAARYRLILSGTSRREAGRRVPPTVPDIMGDSQ